MDWGPDDLPASDRKLLERRVVRYFRPYLRQVLLCLGCILVGAGLGLVPALVTKSLLDYLAHGGGSVGHVLALVAIGIGASVAAAFVGVGEAWLDNRVSQGIMSDLRGQLFERLLDQSTGFFTRRRSGEVMSRLGSDVQGIEHVVSDTLFGLASNLVVAGSTLALMLALDWRLTLIALAAFPLTVLPTRRAGKATYRARMRTQEAQADVTGYLQETLGVSSMFLVKMFGRQPAERARFEQLNDRLRRLEIREAMVVRWFEMVMEIIRTAGPTVLLMAGGWLVIAGHASIGTVFVFATVLTARLYSSAATLGTMRVNVTGSLALFKRLFDYIDLVPEVAELPDARPLEIRGGGVRFEAVGFTYPGSERPALDRVSLDVEPGQFVALVGPTGSGKTTLSHLLPRFFDPQEGRVLIDDQDVRELTFASLSEHIGVVFQDTFLFHASVRDNLLYAKPDAGDAELERAVRAALLEDVIGALPHGLDTAVGERGHSLSGGEKQRLAIARIVLKDPSILILDEATSNLDSVSDALVQAALRPLLERRTSLVIAHRLSTIFAADKIAVLDRGRLVEEGAHAELLKADGLYAKLYRGHLEPGSEPVAAGPVGVA